MRYLRILSSLLIILSSYQHLQSQDRDDQLALTYASNLMAAEGPILEQIIAYFDQTWHPGYLPILRDVIQYQDTRRRPDLLVELMERHTGQSYGTRLDLWDQWIWSQEEQLLSNYGDWMAALYENIDPKFRTYFEGRTSKALIRLDQVKWGGVQQDGIPPLRQPEMIAAASADYLAPTDVVFGISINGDHRAYPKRILAWHEMFTDDIGGLPIAGVYCTLCGTVIAYETQYGDTHHDLGTSGFLYRSNKLMYDRATQSLWSTIEGKPVIGPLINKGIKLKTHGVVTTTWKEWKDLHPDTKVLSLHTGHQRDYNEGVAYATYFGSDELMFNVPALDRRLLNKDEVLVIRTADYSSDPLAISAKFLKRKKVYHDRIGSQNFVVITDKSGANRVYASDGITFKKVMGQKILDNSGGEWQINEAALVQGGVKLERIPAHRIFWFAWFSAYPDTRLVK